MRGHNSVVPWRVINEQADAAFLDVAPNGKKIAHQVELSEQIAKPLRVTSCAEVIVELAKSK